MAKQARTPNNQIEQWAASDAARFLMESHGIVSPYEAMREATQSLLKQVPLESLPVAPTRFARFRRTHTLPYYERMPFEGVLRLEGDTFRIILRDMPSRRNNSSDGNVSPPDDPPEQMEPPLEASGKPPSHVLRRRRFTYAHELCHTFFFDLCTDVPLRPYPYAYGTDEVEERLCNFGAGLLLLPDALLNQHVQQTDITRVGSFVRLCHAFQVSIDALFVRLASCSFLDTKDTFVLLSRFAPNRYTGQDAKMRLQVSIIPKALRTQCYLPQNAGAERIGIKSLQDSYEQWMRTGQMASEPTIEYLTLRGMKLKIEASHEVVPGNRSCLVSYLKVLSD